MMIATIIEALDAAIAVRLPAVQRNGLCELHRVNGGTMPVKHTGAGSFEPVATDASGSFSYWRLSGRLREDAAEIAGSCSDGFTAEIPLRFVALLDREQCGAVEDAARAAASDARAALPVLRQTLKAALLTARSTAIDAVTESVYRAEFSGAGFGMPGAEKAMVAIDITLNVTGRASCFDPCDDAGDFLCGVIQAQQWARIRACLTDGQEAAAIDDLCDGSGPCNPLSYSLSDSDGNVLLNGLENDPCGKQLDLIAPDATVTRDGQPFGTVPSGGTIDVPSDCPECDPELALRINGGRVVGTYPMDCGTNDFDVEVTREDGTPIGEWDAVDERVEVLPGKVQLQDTAANDIGAPVDVEPESTGNVIIAPDTTIVDQSSNPIDSVLAGGTYQVIVLSGIDGGASNTTYTNSIIQP